MGCTINFDKGILGRIKYLKHKEDSEKALIQKMNEKEEIEKVQKRVKKIIDKHQKNSNVSDLVLHFDKNYHGEEGHYLNTCVTADVVTFGNLLHIISREDAVDYDIRMDLLNEILENKDYFESHDEDELCCIFKREQLKRMRKYSKITKEEKRILREHIYGVKFLDLRVNDIVYHSTSSTLGSIWVEKTKLSLQKIIFEQCN